MEAFLKNLTSAFVLSWAGKGKSWVSFWQGSRYHVCPDFANFTMNLRIVFLYSPLIHCSAGKPLAFKFVVLCSHASWPWDIEWCFQDTSVFRTLWFFSWCILDFNYFLSFVKQLSCIWSLKETISQKWEILSIGLSFLSRYILVFIGENFKRKENLHYESFVLCVCFLLLKNVRTL